MKIVLNKSQKVFFTSDTHYNHSNICIGTSNWVNKEIYKHSRNFETLEEMNNSIVSNINDMVGENDILIHLGNWSFGGFEFIKEFRNRIFCKNIYLFLGNHDHYIRRNKDNIRSIFTDVMYYDEITIVKSNGKNIKSDKYRFICSHYPIASWDGMNKGVFHLHGHVHLTPDVKIHKGKAMDVGMDGNFLKPYEMSEIVELLKDKPISHLTLPSFKMPHNTNDNKRQIWYSTLIQSLVQRWLRKVHKVDVNAVFNTNCYYNYTIISTCPEASYVGDSILSVEEYAKFEEALEEGLLEALKIIRNEKKINP